MLQIDKKHILVGMQNGPLFIIDIDRDEAVSDHNITHCPYDMKKTSRPHEYAFATCKGIYFYLIQDSSNNYSSIKLIDESY